MQNEASQKIVERFWMAFDTVRQTQERGWQYNFVKSVGTDMGRFARLKRDNWRSFELSYLAELTQWGVSPEWLLTGKGEMLSSKKKAMT